MSIAPRTLPRLVSSVLGLALAGCAAGAGGVAAAGGASGNGAGASSGAGGSIPWPGAGGSAGTGTGGAAAGGSSGSGGAPGTEKKPLAIAVASSDNFGDHAFAGCQRGAATQSPWVTSAPGAVLGCVYVTENVVLQAGKHYFWQYGKLTELPTPAPPKLIVDAFNLPGVGVDVTNKNNCKL